MNDIITKNSEDTISITRTIVDVVNIDDLYAAKAAADAESTRIQRLIDQAHGVGVSSQLVTD